MAIAARAVPTAIMRLIGNGADCLARDDTATGRDGARALVVLGSPRSGTTLLATAIGAHPAVALLSEDLDGGMFRVVGGKLPAVKLCTPNQVDLDRRWRTSYELIEWNGWLRKNIGYRMPRSRLSLRDMAARTELKVLCVLRDPAHNLAALKRRENKRDAVCRDIVRRTYRLYRRLPGEPRIDARIVSFDRLVQAPEAQLRRMCEWLGLAFDAGMLNAPQLNPLYPEAGFRADRAADAGARDGAPAGLWDEYQALLALAI
jgi:hypothetical protein